MFEKIRILYYMLASFLVFICAESKRINANNDDDDNKIKLIITIIIIIIIIIIINHLY